MFLVTAAAGGRQGATGNHVTRLLRAEGLPVRAFVHRLDARSDALLALGAEVVEGDLLDLTSVRGAMRGTDRAYFAYPVQPGLLEATAIFLVAAREASVQRVVNLSQLLLRTGEQQATEHQTHHWLSEQLFDMADVGAVHLNGVVFFENLRALARPTIAKADALLLPWGAEDTVVPMVSAEDTARVAAAILTGSGLPNGTIVPLIGEAVRMSDMASDFSAVLGRTIQYREISDQQWQQMIAGADVNPVAVKHLTQLWRYIRTRPQQFQRSYKVSDAFGSFAGIRPKTLRQFLQEQADLFQHAPPIGH